MTFLPWRVEVRLSIVVVILEKEKQRKVGAKKVVSVSASVCCFYIDQ